MKKLLAMVLALVMTLSLAVSANAFKDDKDVSADYAEAVAVLDGMGVFQGYEDGSFQPKGDITRAEVATIIYRIYTQDISKNDKSGLYASYNKFSDMTGAGWAAGYIGYCANAEFVKGYPDGTFKPSGKVTGYEVLTMILRTIGYDKNNEFSGADWSVNVAKYAEQAGVLKNVKGVSLSAPATRELVAELLFRAIAKAPMVTYTAAFGYQTVSFDGTKDGKTFKDNETLGHKNFDLDDEATNGDYGRPATEWTYNCGDKSTMVYNTPVATYTEAFAPCDLCKDLSKSKEVKVTVAYVDGENDVKAATDLVATYKSSNTDKDLGDQGQLVEVYENENGKDYTVVVINTYLAQVTKVIDEVKDKNDHVKVEASVNVDVFGWSKDKASFETEGFKKDDLVLVTVDDGEIASMEAAKGETAKLTGAKGVQTVGRSIDGIKNVLAVDYEKATVACKATGNPYTSDLLLGSTYTFYYDTYGNIIGVDFYAPNSDYVVIDRIWADHDNGKGTVYADLIKVENGEKLSKVVVDSIDTIFEAQAMSNIKTLDDADENVAFYADLMTYTVNKDGEYELNNKEDSSTEIGIKVKYQNSWVACSYDSTEDDDVIYTRDGSGNVYLDKDTVILAQYGKSPEGTYKTYTIDNLPTKFVGYVEYVVGSNGKADVAYIQMADVTTGYVFVPEANSTTIDTEMLDKDTVKLTLKDVYIVDNDGKVSDKTTLSVTGNQSNIVIEAFDKNVSSGKFVDITNMKAGLYRVVTLGENDSYLVYQTPKQVSNLNEWSGSKVSFVAGGTKIDLDKVADYTAWTGAYEGQFEIKDDDTNAVLSSTPYSKLFKNVTDTAEDLAKGDWVFVQYDEKGENVVAVYKADFEVSVTDGTAKPAYGYNEFLGKKFQKITVDCADYQTVTATMVNGSSTITLDVDTTTTAGKAIISYTGDDKVVTGNITITYGTKAEYTYISLKNGTVDFDQLSNPQQVIIPQYDSDASKNIIKIDFKDGNVSVKELLAALNSAKRVAGQKVEIYNTTTSNLVSEDTVWEKGGIPYDVRVRVTAWDGVHYGEYLIQTYTAE